MDSSKFISCPKPSIPMPFPGIWAEVMPIASPALAPDCIAGMALNVAIAWSGAAAPLAHPAGVRRSCGGGRALEATARACFVGWESYCPWPRRAVQSKAAGWTRRNVDFALWCGVAVQSGNDASVVSATSSGAESGRCGFLLCDVWRVCSRTSRRHDRQAGVRSARMGRKPAWAWARIGSALQPSPSLRFRTRGGRDTVVLPRQGPALMSGAELSSAAVGCASTCGRWPALRCAALPSRRRDGEAVDRISSQNAKARLRTGAGRPPVRLCVCC